MPASVRFHTPKTLPPPAGYSHAAEITRAKLVYTAGQVPNDAAGNLVGEGDFEAQLVQVFENLKGALAAGGAEFKDVVKLNWYCVASVDPALMPHVRAVRDRYVNTANPPVSTFVFVARLVRPGWLIEVEAVAAVGIE